MKFFLLLLVILLSSGCTLLCPQQKQALLQDQQSFSCAFDDFQLTHRVAELQKFKTDYPDSLWSGRAETIILNSRELDQHKLQLEKMHESERQQSLELEELRKSNQKMTEVIEQLKGLLIQSENHPL